MVVSLNSRLESIKEEEEVGADKCKAATLPRLLESACPTASSTYAKQSTYAKRSNVNLAALTFWQLFSWSATSFGHTCSRTRPLRCDNNRGNSAPIRQSRSRQLGTNKTVK